MPEYSKNKLRKAVKEGLIRAVTLDTNIFVERGSILNDQILRSLDQFKHRSISVIFSEIVAREVQDHISREAEQARDGLNRSFRKYQSSLQNCLDRWDTNIDISQFSQSPSIVGESKEVAYRQFSEFVEHVDAKIIPIEENVNINELTNRYFEHKAPFEDKSYKKHEFPDALALLSLEAWTKNQDGLLLLVSRDGGWEKFAKQSNQLVCIKAIAEALDLFHEEDRTIAEIAVGMLRTADPSYHKIATVIRNYLNQNKIELEFDILHDEDIGTSGLSYTSHVERADLKLWEIPRPDTHRIIASYERTISLSIDVKCTVDFTVLFSFRFPRPCLPNRHMTETIQKTKTMELSMLLTTTRDIGTGPVLKVAKIPNQRIAVDFGTLRVTSPPIIPY